MGRQYAAGTVSAYLARVPGSRIEAGKLFSDVRLLRLSNPAG